MAIAALEAAPEEISLALKRQAEVTNLPRVGYEGNYAHPTMQANFAPTQPASALVSHSYRRVLYRSSVSAPVSRMKEDLGSFGGKHIDDHDSPGGYTSMITYSNIAPDEHPGMFIVSDLGIAVGA